MLLFALLTESIQSKHNTRTQQLWLEYETQQLVMYNMINI